MKKLFNALARGISKLEKFAKPHLKNIADTIEFTCKASLTAVALVFFVSDELSRQIDGQTIRNNIATYNSPNSPKIEFVSPRPRNRPYFPLGTPRPRLRPTP